MRQRGQTRAQQLSALVSVEISPPQVSPRPQKQLRTCVAQGYDTGLAGLATDYGINVEA